MNTNEAKLGLGGHSFIEQLGNDPLASFEEQCEIVTACLDSGISLIDTTYYQERVALGRVMQKLGRRDEARIMAWNFFKQPGKEDELVGYTPYEEEHLQIMLEELQMEYIDILVIHVHDDSDKLRQELKLAKQWVDEGKVKQVGLGMAALSHLQQLPDDHPVSFVLAPYNAFNTAAEGLFHHAKNIGLEVIALSPFIRGWKLDEIGEDTKEVSEILLRWAAWQPLAEYVVVSMRKAEWVHANLRAVERGPLTREEQTRLDGWVARVGK
jgi:aryl-alcohol dehydrogenase-like predicted oxidoreductase